MRYSDDTKHVGSLGGNTASEIASSPNGGGAHAERSPDESSRIHRCAEGSRRCPLPSFEQELIISSPSFDLSMLWWRREGSGDHFLKLELETRTRGIYDVLEVPSLSALLGTKVLPGVIRSYLEFHSKIPKIVSLTVFVIYNLGSRSYVKV